MRYMTEIAVECGCHDMEVRYVFGKKSFANMVCGKCNQNWKATKPHYITIPDEINNQVLVMAWIKDVMKPKLAIGLTNLSRLLQAKLTYGSEEQAELARQKQIPPQLKEVIETQAGPVSYYGEVLSLRKLNINPGTVAAIAHCGRRIKIETLDAIAILTLHGDLKGIDVGKQAIKDFETIFRRKK